MHNRLLIFVWIAWCVMCGGSALARDRIFKRIDFEERELGNAEDLPMHWVKIAGEGLPHYVKGKLSDDQAHSGKFSFRMDLDGGSVIYRYDPREIPVQTGASYRVECYCQTTPMPYARAQLTAYFVDQDGHLLPNTVVASAPYSAKKADDGWRELSSQLKASDARAARLVIEMGLVQPSFYQSDTLGARSLHGQDIHGTAWFDDVTVSQVPQLTLKTPFAGNIVKQGEHASLIVGVSDRYTDDLVATIDVSDATGASVYQHSGDINLASARRVNTSESEVTLPLPELSPGWYQARLRVSSGQQIVGDETANIVELADRGDPSAADGRFGLNALDVPCSVWAEFPGVLPYLSAGRIKLAVWSREQDVQTQDPGAFDRLLESLQPLGITPTACLTGVPPAVAKRVGSVEWQSLLTAKPSDWQPQLAYLISRHANHLDRWQLGADGSDEFVSNARMRQVYQLIYQQFTQLIQAPDLAMPWPAWCEMDKDVPATIALSVPAEVLPRQLPLYMQSLTTRPTTRPQNLSLSLQLLNESYGRDARIRDLAQRMIYAMAGGATRVDLPFPFDSKVQNGAMTSQPQELFLIERTLMQNLSGAAYKGQTPIAPGIEAFLFDRDGRAFLVVWSRATSSAMRSLAINLGPAPTKLDLWGNATALARSGSGDGTVQLDVGPTPFFVMDVDETSALLRAGVSLDRPLVESSFQTHTRHIRFTNPAKAAITGSLKLHAPKGWSIVPDSFQMSVNPGQTFDRQITIDFPYNSSAGPRTIDANFVLESERTQAFSVPLNVFLGLSDVGLQSLVLRDGADLLVQQMITNYGETPIDYATFAICPGQSRQERQLTGLQPGRTAIKLYRFADVNLPAGSKIRSGLRQLEGMRILNDEVDIQQ